MAAVSNPAALAIATLVLVTLMRCGTKSGDGVSIVNRLGVTATDVLSGLLTEHESVCFRSNDGRRLGLDADLDLVLHADGNVVMKNDSGIVPSELPGTFTVTPQGNVSLHIGGYSGPFARMRLLTDGGDLGLVPDDARYSDYNFKAIEREGP